MTNKERPSWSLYEIVEKMNGGDIEPYGETNHDKATFERMKRLEVLILELIADFMVCAVREKAPEASIQEAATEANRFLKEIADWIREADTPRKKGLERAKEIVDAEAWAYCDYLLRKYKGGSPEAEGASALASNIRERIDEELEKEDET